MRRRYLGPAIPSAGLRSATYRPPRPGSLRMTATPADASVDDLDPADPASYQFWTEARLRYADLDPLSHVNNNAIGVCLENGRVYLLRASGGSEARRGGKEGGRTGRDRGSRCKKKKKRINKQK